MATPTLLHCGCSTVRQSIMIRRLLILILLLLAPAVAQAARGIEPQLVAEGSAPPGGEVELAIEMRTRPGWHGYWLNPGDAGLPMAVQWQLPAGYSVGPLRYPVPTRLTVAGIMNYVFEKDYAVLVRLTVPKDAKGVVPIRASAQLARLHRQDLRSGKRDDGARHSGRNGRARPAGAVRRRGDGRFPDQSSRLPRSRLPVTSCAWRCRSRATSRSASPTCFRRPTVRSTMRPSRNSGGWATS